MDIRNYNIGESDYSIHKIQPWDIWIEYRLNPFDADIVKRILRHKKTDPRKLDYQKIIHICLERIRQIDEGKDPWNENYDNKKDIVSSGDRRNNKENKQRNTRKRTFRRVH